ncbi:MAG TPA: glycosyltransferase family 2 protein [Candidatus Dormibacteraeota bacterium]|nr:glycosyltransferase family 2 protein [Candidatus Dormibacteraeota bacterium]
MKENATAAIVVNYNGGAANLACVESLLGQVDEIVVVDNGSSDGSLEMLQERFGDRARFMAMGKNVGLSLARNAGAFATSSSYLLFFDNDAVARAGMVAALQRVVEQHPEIGIVAPVVLDAHSPEIVQTTGLTIDRWGFPVDATTGVRVAELPAYDLRPAFFVQGCALMVRAALFSQLHGYDEGIFFGGEDVDICWRAWLAGSTVVSVRDAFCEHKGASTLGFDVRGSFYTPGLRGERYTTSTYRIANREANTFRMMVANLNRTNAAAYVLVFSPVLLLEAAAAFFTGRWSIANAYLATFGRIITQLPDTLRRRRSVQAKRCMPDSVVTRMWSRGYEKLAFLRRNGIPKVPAPR